jgi:GT2 family glycosyltransferase
MGTTDIIVVTHKYENIKKCLENIILPQNVKIWVVVNGIDTKTVEYLKSISYGNSNIKYVISETNIPKSRARNIGVRAADSEIVYFIDDDAYFTADNIGLVKKKFSEYPEVDIIGGPNITPPGSTGFQRLSGYLLSSAVVAGGMRKRYAGSASEGLTDDMSLILCNLAIKRNVFEKENIYFDERLHYNEENLLLSRLKNKGYKMLHCPELVVYHHRRKDLYSFARQVFGSGKGRAIMTYIMPRSVSLVHLMPVALMIYAAALFVLGRYFLAWLPLIAYLLAVIFNSCYIAVKNREKYHTVITMTVISMVAHLSYGAGFVAGAVRRLI